MEASCRRARFVKFGFYLQGNVGAFKRNERTIRNYCKDGKLEAGMMLIFRQMPDCQQKCEVSNRILFRV